MKILFVLLLALGCYANPTGSELKKPNSTAFDFTFQSPQNKIQETLSDMILVEISKQTLLERRQENLWQCQTDQFGTTYCPTGLESAKSYTAYSPSTSLEREATVIDYEQGTYAEKTSVVRDFMDGFANTHNSTVIDYQTGSGTSNVGTVIDYQNGSSVAGVGQVVDYTNKEEDASSPAILMQKGVKAERAANGLYYTVVISSETTYGAKTTCSSLGSGWRLPQGNETGSGGVPVGGQEYVIPNYSNYCSGNGDFATLGDCAKYSLSPAKTNDWTSPRRNYRCVNTSPVNIVNGYVVISGYTVTKAGNGLYYTNVFPGKVPTGARDFCRALGGEWRLPQGCETGSGKVPVGGQEYVYTDRCACNNGYTLSTKSDCKGYQFGWGDVRAFRCVATNPSNVIHKATCPQGYTETIGSETSKGECKRTVSYNFYQYTCPSTYTPINYGFTSYTKTDPNTSTQNWNSLDDAVNSATPPPNNCQKTVTYSYYKYNCPTGYTVRDGGLTSACPKTDPDKTINNEATLSQPCNNSTPPTGNCEKIIPYTFYSYECSSGYTAIDKGLATCTKTDSSTSTNTSSTLSQPCNSATPPKENCYKDISYKHYTYGCSPGYITDNYGLSTCPKTDPNKSVNNSATLDDDCNSKTPPEGNCRRSYSYKYYEYLCQGKNSFLESYKTLNKGLASCTKTDTNKNAVNSELANACNSSTPPANNCQSTEYACDSTLFKPVYVGGKWVCSPYLCNDDMKCGYGTCDLPTTPSATKYQDIAYNPLGTVNDNKCNGDICDFVVNARVTYCESKQCPKGDDIIEKNGKCYKLECPAGTYLSGEKCIKVN